ncbi:hypothetical protein EQP59_00070 [Ornithobacterium rhinotracheale]|uniref:HTTM domain-containing protein n=1 Tax=Ornithobacterium rhinotracheale TaxID=28251 RepID=A0A410JP00_ORNRH|nr:HTTM domain-containing protein [Ornithobacterium rhinotracheale]QAR29867.1 hypothetical protein EQP59_00070 [Ornithobacterium rhinotracheale]
MDGGDHITSVLTFLLIPITITDNRKNHWIGEIHKSNTLSSTISNAFLFLIKIQVCAIYFHAFVGKIPIDEWSNGTATYYWLTHEHFGINEIFRPLFIFILSKSFLVSIITWGILVLEFLLSACIILDKKSKTKKIMFILGVFFHFLILIIHGLFTFFFAATAGLVLYLLSDYSSLKNITLPSSYYYGKWIKRNFSN